MGQQNQGHEHRAAGEQRPHDATTSLMSPQEKPCVGQDSRAHLPVAEPTTAATSYRFLPGRQTWRWIRLPEIVIIDTLTIVHALCVVH